MADPLPPTNTYCVSFETKGNAGYIKAVQVTLEEVVMDVLDEARVDLVCHPLYPKLQRYVLANLKHHGKR